MAHPGNFYPIISFYGQRSPAQRNVWAARPFLLCIHQSEHLCNMRERVQKNGRQVWGKPAAPIYKTLKAGLRISQDNIFMQTVSGGVALESSL